MTMEVLKTTVGYALKQLFPGNIAFTIASFLVESDEERTAKAKIKWWYESLTHYELKGKKPSFERYKKNLRYGPYGVYSYGTEVIELNWKNRTAKRLGKWSKTTSRHMKYAIKNLADTWGFKEIK